MVRHRLAATAIAVLAAMSPVWAWACPMCKDSIPSSDAESPGGLPSGFNTSIYIMLGSVFLVFGFVAVFLIRTIRADDNRGFAVAPLEPGETREHL